MQGMSLEKSITADELSSVSPETLESKSYKARAWKKYTIIKELKGKGDFDFQAVCLLTNSHVPESSNIKYQKELEQRDSNYV